MTPISICIPVYNGREFVKDAVQSVLSQDYPYFEVNVVDNCSTDSTPEILRELSDPNLRLHFPEDHVPMAPNFQRAAQTGSHPFVLMLSADDILLPGALAAFGEALTKNPEVDLFSGRARRIKSGVSRELAGAQYSHKEGVITRLEEFVVTHAFPLNINATMIRKDLINLRDGAGLVFDLDLILSLGLQGKVGFLMGEEVTGYREHEAAASADKIRMWRETLAVYQFHYSSTAFKKLYERRIFRTLFWCASFLAAGNQKEGARELVGQFSSILGRGRVGLLRLMILFPFVLRILEKVRGIRGRLMGVS